MGAGRTILTQPKVYVMKNKFWKIIAILVIILWTATLCTWYAVKTTPPRYLKSSQLILDTKENKFYHYSYRRWMPCTVPYAEHPHPQDIQWKYLEEITGYNAKQYKSINYNLSANTIIQGLDQNNFTISELRDVVEKITDWKIDNLFRDRDPDAPESKSEYNKIIQSIDNPNIKALFHEKSI